MFGGKEVKKNDYKEEANKLYAEFKTTLGDFEIELYAKECPETVWNFVNLAEGRQETKRNGPFYDGLIFHRVIEGFMIQGGCPDGTGMGGPGYRFRDEIVPMLRHNVEGILSMANAGPGTNGSQFFITLAPTPHLDGRHTVFGKVVKGMNVVHKIGVTKTNPQDRPLTNVTITNIKIRRE
ncbi:MAG: cyclophilin [Bdellovibrionales bacterium RIFOXYD12_FULL_39_22]|nr:MAG: cyclophilin [Bdellovibrionales bacterium RIFOXYB1_FULL_39_21]OFZ42846.1 MAG: cyclophilin [Bdellovibrionales bacterium RIFOXYC12_FULL_39_17]OFZ47494.1 MAG: cyclophilin [Bdellovibrionales bacterium RIFOXYC1_FULL_39_130]OFZ69728.1 MAG: cyclophilin [Bdellovibrionales bacterium RIFOXYC2_FULL_39_8]OFZ75582.1 MAG: cyclophilin [Bdellovibrionales bacterium RIFOXYD1_FULL_39_84]OFZ93905.1 MAG: cyclophilin [Bdellovibrionales bacterium RIFOXYD12_FULL_39_22]HLE10089.1 peptidylprolyl isomerase [Bact